MQAAERYENPFFAQQARIALAQALLLQDSSLPAARQVLAEIRRAPASPVLQFLLGRAYAGSGKLEAARKTAHTIEKLAAEREVPAVHALRHLMAAEIALAERRPGDAVLAAQKAVAYQNSSLAVETLARCYQNAGMDREAAQQYESVLARGNERSESFDAPAFHSVVEAEYQLGVLDQKLGRVESARAHLQRFLAYWSHGDPDLRMDKEAQRLLGSLPTGTPTAAR